jgi:hypothetical protein
MIASTDVLLNPARPAIKMSLCSEAVDSFLRKSKSLMRGAHDRLSLSMEHLTDSQLANRKRKTGDQMAYDIFRTYLFVFY